jgi:hypothetical protein
MSTIWGHHQIYLSSYYFFIESAFLPLWSYAQRCIRVDMGRGMGRHGHEELDGDDRADGGLLIRSPGFSGLAGNA